jgi:hypothetical protein
MEVTSKDSRIVSNTTMIAISSDHGNNWTFIDASNKSLEELRKALPNISKDLIIPPHQRPVRYSN